MDRRQFMFAAGSALAGLSSWMAGCRTWQSRTGTGPARELRHLDEGFAAIETQSGGRLGVAFVDTQAGARAGHRANERFSMCSTFKLLAVAAMLARVDVGKDSLRRRVQIQQADLTAYSPATRNRVGGQGVSVSELCEAAMVLSDNTAANLLLRDLDGPAGVTAYVRSLGDTQTRLDRTEPDLNSVST